MDRENGPSEEEMGLVPEESRVLSDAELIKGGARKVSGGRLDLTKEQIVGAKAEMEIARAEEMKRKFPVFMSVLDQYIEAARMNVNSGKSVLDDDYSSIARERFEQERNKLITLKDIREQFLAGR